MFLTLLLLCSALTSVHGKTTDQTLFSGCPINYGAEYSCCNLMNGTKYLMTTYNRPPLEAYKHGWTMARQVNFPYHMHTPNTPSFVYDAPGDICRLTYQNNTKVGYLESSLVCKRVAGFNEKSFTTFAQNPRNNLASCPGIATRVTGNPTAIQACKVPSRPIAVKYHTFAEAPFLVVYLAYGLCFALLLGWAWYKRSIETSIQSPCNSRIQDKKHFQVDLEAGNKHLIDRKETRPFCTTLSAHEEEPPKSLRRDSELQLERCVDDITQIGYQDHSVGTMILMYFGFLSLALNILLIISIVDYYGGFGVALITPGETALKMFIILWFIETFWYTAVVVLQKRIRNFFRIEVPLADATSIYMFKPSHAEILLSDQSGVSNLVNRIEAMLFRQSQNGFDATVKVGVTSRGTKVLEFQYLRYIYSKTHQRFVPGSIHLGTTYNDIQQRSSGVTEEEHRLRLDTVGANSIEVEVPSMATSLREELFQFFYIYQLMCYYVWYYFTYWNMGLVMSLVVVGTAAINIITKRRMQASVVQMTKYQGRINVCRNGKWKTVHSGDIVPGDLVRIQENWIVPCDMVIVHGSTVCDESMLTGESMPVQKFSIPECSNEIYHVSGTGKKHTLYSGTKVLASGRNEDILAVVQTTGSHTSKGQLVQSILFPIPMKFKYHEHLKVVMVVLFVYSTVACYFALSFLTSNGNLTNTLSAWASCIFMLSAVVSPLLPVVITVGQVNAARRLEKVGVFSLDAQRITMSGKVRIFCFDKTGTLTKEGLDFLGCQPIDEERKFLPVERDVTRKSLNPTMKAALASCHSIGSLNGELVGNQVEVKMFLATQWQLIEEEGRSPRVKSPEGNVLEVIKRFEFDHHRMSMSVVMRDTSTGHSFVFCKGSYEKMHTLSSRGSTSIPTDYFEAAERLARDGCYVLGIGVKQLPRMLDSHLSELVKDRDAVEEGLSCLGLILFRNELKPDTAEAIEKLRKGDTRTVMITGDNAMCGCYIARESGMVNRSSVVILGDMIHQVGDKEPFAPPIFQWSNVDTRETLSMAAVQQSLAKGEDVELALTGQAFDYLISTGEMKNLLLHVRIFSRMTPDGKVRCVQMHMETGAVTGMCGDGGNDCGALRQAHVGIALSDAEASIVSPFTSKSKTITSVVDLCREGRCSVATSFASVKMLIMYGLIGSTLRLIQYYYGVLLSEWCFILTDGFILVGLSYVITLSRPLKVLGSQRPTSSLVGPTTIFSIVGQELINVFFLYLGIHLLTSQSWYCPFSPDNVDLAKWWLLSDNAMATCSFYCGVFQQQTAAWVFSFGSRYRMPIWRNHLLCFFYGCLLALDFYLVLGPPSRLTDLFRIASSTNVIGLPDIPLSFNFRFKFLGVILGNMLAVILYERVVILGPVRSFFRRKYHRDHIRMKL